MTDKTPEPGSALETYLEGVDAAAVPVVTALDRAVREAHPGFDVAGWRLADLGVRDRRDQEGRRPAVPLRGAAGRPAGGAGGEPGFGQAGPAAQARRPRLRRSTTAPSQDAVGCRFRRAGARPSRPAGRAGSPPCRWSLARPARCPAVRLPSVPRCRPSATSAAKLRLEPLGLALALTWRLICRWWPITGSMPA